MFSKARILTKYRIGSFCAFQRTRENMIYFKEKNIKTYQNFFGAAILLKNRRAVYILLCFCVIRGTFTVFQGSCGRCA